MAAERVSYDPPAVASRVVREVEQASIGVLAFTNMSNNPENEYFSDGITEEILNALTRIPALKVAARSSSFALKGKSLDIREIGERLKVKTVLEGSVRRVGQRVRITAQLINAADGYHLWSERYDRDVEDVFEIQEEIARTIVDRLKVKLGGAEYEAIGKGQTENVEAYELYLRGRHCWNRWQLWGMMGKAIGYYEAALAKTGWVEDKTTAGSLLVRFSKDLYVVTVAPDQASGAGHFAVTVDRLSANLLTSPSASTSASP